MAAHQRLSFLNDASRALSESLELSKILSALAGLTVPRFAHWCLVDLVNEQGQLELVANADVDPRKAALLREMRKLFPPDPRAHPAQSARLSGKPQVVSAMGKAWYRKAAASAAHRRMLLRLDPGPHLCVPLKAAGRSIGALSLGFGRAPTPADVKLAEELGLRAGVAIENSRLYEKAHLAEETLTRALSATRMVAWSWDLASGKVDRSANAAEIYGLEPGAEIGRGLELLHPADRRGYEEVLARAAGEGGAYSMRFRMLRPDGQARWMEDHGSVIRGSNGKASRVAGVVMDVTELKAAEDVRRVQSAAGRILWSAKAIPRALREFLKSVGETFGWQAGFAWQKEASTGTMRLAASWAASGPFAAPTRGLRRWPELRKGCDLPGVAWARGKATWIGDLKNCEAFGRARAAAKAGLRGCFLFPLKGRDGALGVVEFYAADGSHPAPAQPELFDAVGRQVAQFIERQAAEKTLSRQRAEQQLILDSVNAMIWFKDAGNKILRCNRAAASWCGKPMEEIEGRSALEIFPEQARGYHADDLSVIASGQPKLGLIECLESPKGGRRWVRRDVIPYADASGKPAGVIVFALDVTEVKEAEAVLRESERTQKEFVANVSHEFRTPVAAIKGFAETLLEGGLNDAGHRRRFVRIIQNHADRLGWLVEDVLTLSSLESGKELSREPLDLGQLVAEHLSTLPAVEKRRRVAIHNGVPLGLVAAVDRRYFMLVIENLLANAVKYNKPGGSVWLEAVVAGSQIGLTVRDDGVGIRPDDLRRVFDRFFRVEKRDSRGYCGLGLHLVKKIVEAHGGRLTAESELGKGSRFHVAVPAGGASAPALSAP